MIAFESLSQTIHTKKKLFLILFSTALILFSPHKFLSLFVPHSALRTPLSPGLPFH